MQPSDSEDELGPRRDFSRTGDLTGETRRRRGVGGRGGSEGDSAVSLSAEGLPRQRNRRAPAAGGGDGRGDGASTPTTSRRLTARSRRQSEREGFRSADDDDTGSQKGGPRSPMRDRTARSKKLAEAGIDEDEDGEGDDVEEQAEAELEDDLDLLRIDQPQHVQPLTFLYNSRSRENAMQPLVVAPVPQPSLASFTSAYKHRRSEMDILNGDTDKVTLLGADNSSGDSAAHFAPNGELLGAKTRRDDGLFVGQSPVLAALLLKGEPLASPAVAEGVTINPQLNLARVTQRTLRDLQRAVESQRVRQEWARLLNSARGGSPRPRDLANTDTTIDPPTAPARLLQQLSIGPMTQIIEDPLDLQTSQPVLPEVDASYGGKLGNWSASATLKERLGVIPGERSHRVSRSVLRVHVHQLTLLDHPLVSVEERLAAQLKSSFAVYRSLMEQQTLPYLSSRLVALRLELQRLMAGYDQVARAGAAGGEAKTGPAQDEEDEEMHALIVKISATFSDVTETLPALSELRSAVDSLTSGLYEQWTSLQRTRKDQGGFSSTKASLLARRLARNGDDQGDEGADGEGLGVGGESPQKVWSELSAALTDLPSLMRRAQAVLLAADKARSMTEGSGAGGGGDVAAQAASGAESGSSGGRANRGRLSPRGLPREGASSARAAGGGESAAATARTPRSRNAELGARYEKICAVADDACADLMRAKGLLPEYVLRLTDTGSITPTAQVNAEEQRRRNDLEALRFKIVVRVNGQTVSSTAAIAMAFPSLAVSFKQYFEFRLLHQPSSLVLDVMTVGSSSTGFDKDSLVASICVPLPGQKDPYSVPAASGQQHTASPAVGALAPTVGWLAFSSEDGVMGHAGATAVTGTAASGNNMRGPLPMSRVSGLVLCASEYDSRSAESAARDPDGNRSKLYEGIPTTDLAQLPAVMPLSSGAAFSAFQGRGSRSAGISQRILQGYENLDPNDPRNEMWLKSASRGRLEPGMERPAFHLDGLDFSVPFAEDGMAYDNYLKFQGSLRMQLLHLRQVKPYLFSEPIPMTDAEIRGKEIYKALLSLEPDPLMNLGDDPALTAIDDDGGSSHAKAKISNFMERVRQGRVAQSVKARKKLTTTGAVAEVQYFNPVELENLDHLLPEQKRALRPNAKARQPTTMQVHRCDLLVQIVGARNVPLREEKPVGASVGAPGSPKKKRAGAASGYGSGGYGSSGESDGESRGDGAVAEEFLDETKLEFQRRAKTFVEVRFQEHARRTGVNAGRSPLWKESLSIPFRPPQNDFTPANLAQVRDNIYFSLFDECTEDYSWSGSFSDGETTVFNERRYLGSFVLPFSTVWASADGRIDGVFRLDLPCINFGYVPAPPIESVVNMQRSMFKEEAAPAAGGGDSEVDPFHQPTLFEAMLSLVLPKKTFQHLVAGWSKRSRKQSELQDFGVVLRPAMEKEFEYFAGNSSTTYIKLMITLDPILVSPPHIPQEVALSSLYSEDKPYAGAARSWLHSVHRVSKFTKERPYRVFGSNTRGLNVLLCRYLIPMQPPQGFASRRACIHLVSLLPFMADAQTFQGESDMWCTAKESWDTGAGDEEEHATILYNYLYYLHHVESSNPNASDAGNIRASRGHGRAAGGGNRNAPVNDAGRPVSYPTEQAVRSEHVFLVVGRAVPEGDSVYVLLRDEMSSPGAPHSPSNFILINPCTGQMFPAGDPRCPLIEVACLVTPYNIWANIQPGSMPSELSYDVLNPDQWRPFFGRRLPPPTTGLHSLQDEVSYKVTSSSYALEIERTIRENIVANLRKWRAKRRNPATSLHPDMSNYISEMLPKLEQWKRNGIAESVGLAASATEGLSPLEILQAEMGTSKRVMTIMQTRKLHGSPLNMAFTDADEVLNKVKSLCIHETNHPEVQFVVAVRVFPLVNDIVSLWIFVGTLESARRG